MVNYLLLQSVLPSSVFLGLADIVPKYGLINNNRLAHFLSQCAYESLNFTRTEENLRYSSKRLRVVFKKYFTTEEMANEYEYKPIAIASRVYANRMGNASEDTQEGWLYRGRGYIQLTGKDNYKLFDKVTNDNIIDNSDLVASKYALESAVWFWKYKRLNELADQGTSENEVALITKHVNGGFTGLEERTKLFNKFLNLLQKE